MKIKCHRYALWSLMAVAPSVVSAQGAEPIRWSCIMSLLLPTNAPSVAYDPGGTGAGTVTASISFRKDARPEITLAGPNPAKQEVTVALALSQFDSDSCAGETATLVFNFVLIGKPSEESYLPDASFTPPNIFTIKLRRRRPPDPLRTLPPR